MICKDGNREDEGILRKDSDGRYWISSSREAGDKWSDQLAQMGDGEESLIREIEAVVDQGIKRDMKSGHVRRMAIAAAVTGAGKAEKTMDDKMEEVSGLMSEAKAAAERNGTDAHDEIAKDLDAFHSITGAKGAQGLIEMVVVPLSVFKSQGQIPRRSFRGDECHIP